MTELFDASAQWANRPSEERFTSLVDMHDMMTRIRKQSRALVAPSRRLHVVPTDDAKGLLLEGPSGNQVAPTHYAFGQLATLAGAPAGYLRDLPSPIAADCLNYGLQYVRDVEDVGVLLTRTSDDNGSAVQLRAATGPNYGRIWNSDIVGGLMRAFGDGVSGRFKVPGEFGRDVEVTKANTTLYASDRDMFVFLADERNRIELPGRDSLARGFFVWNSEVGAATFGIKSFLFRYACCNRIVWGAEQVQEIRIRHTSKAPVRWMEEMAPALQTMADSSTHSVVRAIEDAKSHRLDDVSAFLAARFGKGLAARMNAAHLAEEERPIETRWDVVTGATAVARNMTYTADRVELETQAGTLLAA